MGEGCLCYWLDLVIVVFVAVSHGYALHPPLPHRGGGLLQGQPVADRVVHLAVQRGVRHPLQTEVPVLLLKGEEEGEEEGEVSDVWYLF